MLRSCLAVLAVLSCWSVVACSVTLEGPVSPDEPSTPAATPAAGLPSPAVARTRLAGLRLAARDAHAGTYVRAEFGSSWSDVDGNGCNQRDDVLLRDAVPGTAVVARQGRCDHDVLAGTWVDPYTGRTLRFDDLKEPAQARGVQIDHVVPLAEAWGSGAASWTAERRRRFANDLRELLAVDGPTNAGKSDDDPAAWRPRKAYQCTYAIRWIRVKDAWGLATDRSERRALEEMLDSCP